MTKLSGSITQKGVAGSISQKGVAGSVVQGQERFTCDNTYLKCDSTFITMDNS